MGKSLDELLTGLREEEQTPSHTPPSKMIKCPGCGSLYGCSGYTSDFVCPGCASTKDSSNDALTSPTYNWIRNDTKVKNRTGRMFDAIPYKEHREKTVQDNT
jgi:hypothetical protein